MKFDASAFAVGRVTPVKDPAFLRRVEQMERVFPEVRLHRQALQLLGSDIVYLRELPGSQGCWVALIRFGRHLEGALSLTREVMAYYTPHHDFQLRDYEKFPDVRDGLPRRPNDELYLVSSRDPRADKKLEDWTVREPFSAICMPSGAIPAEHAAGMLLESLTRCLASRNLYEETLPVTGTDFFGRRDLLVTLSAQLRQGRVCGVFGLRKTGKTSLIKELGRLFVASDPTKRIFVLRDLEDLPTDPEKHATALQADLKVSLLPQLRQLGLRTHELALLPDDASLGDFRRAIQATLGHVDSRNVQIVVALDEVESLVGTQAGSGLDRPYVPEFFGLLRSLVQENANFNVLLSGLTSSVLESGLLYGRENPLFAWAKPYYVPPLEKQEADELVTALGRRMALYWTPEALSEAFQLTDGHVFLLRTLCARIATDLPKGLDSRLVQAERVRSGGRRWRREVAEQVKQMMNSLDRFYPDEAALLALMNDGQVGAEEADELYPSEVNHLEKLGLISLGSDVQMTAFARMALRA